jgi:hypothetical protein
MLRAGLELAHGQDEKFIQYLCGKSEEKRPIGRPGCRWEDNTGLDIREIGREVVNWMHMTQDRDQRRVIMNTVLNLRVP